MDPTDDLETSELLALAATGAAAATGTTATTATSPVVAPVVADNSADDGEIGNANGQSVGSPLQHQKQQQEGADEGADEGDVEQKRAREMKTSLFANKGLDDFFGDEDEEEEFKGFDLNAADDDEEDDFDRLLAQAAALRAKSGSSASAPSAGRARAHDSDESDQEEEEEDDDDDEEGGSSKKRKGGKKDSKRKRGESGAAPKRSRGEYRDGSIKFNKRITPDSEKKKKPKRRKRTIEEEQDRVDTLVSKMRQAHEEDVQQIRMGEAARQRYQLLQHVIIMLLSQETFSTLMSEEEMQDVDSPLTAFLIECGNWLKPTVVETLVAGEIKQTTVMANLELRERLLKTLFDSPFTRDNKSLDCLKRSKIGQVIVSILKNPRESKENKLVAQKLINAWSELALKGNRDINRPPPLRRLSSAGDGAASDDPVMMRETRVVRPTDRARVIERPVFKFADDVDLGFNSPVRPRPSEGATRHIGMTFKQVEPPKVTRPFQVNVQGRGIK